MNTSDNKPDFGTEAAGVKPEISERMRGLGITPELVASRPFRFLEKTDRSSLDSIRCGILFSIAPWSGPARQGFAELKRVLAEVDPAGILELVVVAYEGLQPSLFESQEFAFLMGGFGETIWIREGRMVSNTGRGYHPECFEPNTRGLLQECLQIRVISVIGG
jgi:hypothetical protein